MFRFVNANAGRHPSLWDSTTAPEVIRSRGGLPLRGNEIGRTLANLTYRSLVSAHEKISEERAKLSLLVLLVSLRRHQQDRGRLPPTLQELVPSYLAEVPVDPYTREAMAYSLADRSISSACGLTVKIISKGTP